MNEIGGYMELEKIDGNEYYENAITLNTARNALKYLIFAKKIKTILIPNLLCDTVEFICKVNGVKVNHYEINSNFIPQIDGNFDKNEYLYFVNYYGLFDNNELKKWKNLYSNIIIDQAHSFFQKPLINTDVIYSCRKFFGVPDGAYLFTNKKCNLFLSMDKSYRRMKHILGRFEDKNANKYYSFFRKVEDSFENIPLRKMSLLTHNLLRGINYRKVIEIREKNYKYLSNAFDNKNKLILTKARGLYCYPLYVEDGIEVRKRLQEAKIYVPILWKENGNCIYNEIERDYAINILPLPIDQRYTEKDMEKIIKIIKS